MNEARDGGQKQAQATAENEDGGWGCEEKGKVLIDC